MAKHTGEALAIVLGSGAIAYGRNWTYTARPPNVDVTAAGDGTVDRKTLRLDYTFEGTALIAVPTGSNPYAIQNAEGQPIAWGGKLQASDANPLVGGTGILEEVVIAATYDGATEFRFRIVAAGTPATYDLTPAT